MMFKICLFLCFFGLQVQATCDGNPHKWDRQRRCDQYDPKCPELYSGCTVCEGVGGIATGDLNDEITPVKCKIVGDAAAMKKQGVVPAKPLWPKQFVNDQFYEVQIFVKHDPFCFVQIPASVSNGTHCYKAQEGVFNYDITKRALRIDYLQSRTTFKFNMTEKFHHINDAVHPEITRYGFDKVPICPCINVSVGPVASNWASDSMYLGREELDVEFIGGTYTVDHFVKGPHHAWVDTATGNIVRLWQPFNGLEVFHPNHYVDKVTEDLTVMSGACKLGAKACIQAFPNKPSLSKQFDNMVQSVKDYFHF